MECTTAKYEATVTASPTTEAKTIVPTITGCAFAGGAVDVHLNGCKLNFTRTTDASGDAQVAIVDY
jgi:hypothetical protein